MRMLDGARRTRPAQRSCSLVLSGAHACAVELGQATHQRFLTELSERPGRRLAISAHRVPSLACISRMMASSCTHGSRALALLRGAQRVCERVCRHGPMGSKNKGGCT